MLVRKIMNPHIVIDISCITILVKALALIVLNISIDDMTTCQPGTYSLVVIKTHLTSVSDSQYSSKTAGFAF